MSNVKLVPVPSNSVTFFYNISYHMLLYYIILYCSILGEGRGQLQAPVHQVVVLHDTHVVPVLLDTHVQQTPTRVKCAHVDGYTCSADPNAS